MKIEGINMGGSDVGKSFKDMDEAEKAKKITEDLSEEAGENKIKKFFGRKQNKELAGRLLAKNEDGERGKDLNDWVEGWEEKAKNGETTRRTGWKEDAEWISKWKEEHPGEDIFEEEIIENRTKDFARAYKNKQTGERKRASIEIGKQVGKAGVDTAATLAGVKSFYSVPKYLWERYKVRGIFGRGKGLEGSVEELLSANQDMHKRIQAGEGRNEQHGEVREAITDLNNRLKLTREGGQRGSEQRKMLAKLLWENRQREQDTKEERESEISKILKDYTTTKTTGVEAARDSLNTFFTASSSFPLRAISYGLMDGVERYQNQIREHRRQKEDVKGFKDKLNVIAKEVIIGGIKKTFDECRMKSPEGQKATKLQKTFSAIAAWGRIARYFGLGAMAEWHPQTAGDAMEKALKALEGKISWSDVGHNFTGNIERQANFYSGIAKKIGEDAHSAAGLFFATDAQASDNVPPGTLQAGRVDESAKATVLASKPTVATEQKDIGHYGKSNISEKIINRPAPAAGTEVQSQPTHPLAEQPETTAAKVDSKTINEELKRYAAMPAGNDKLAEAKRIAKEMWDNKLVISSKVAAPEITKELQVFEAGLNGAQKEIAEATTALSKTEDVNERIKILERIEAKQAEFSGKLQISDEDMSRQLNLFKEVKGMINGITEQKTTVQLAPDAQLRLNEDIVKLRLDFEKLALAKDPFSGDPKVRFDLLREISDIKEKWHENIVIPNEVEENLGNLREASHGLSSNFDITLGKNGVPAELERVFSAIAADHMQDVLGSDQKFSEEEGAKILNIAQNLIKLTEGKNVTGFSPKDLEGVLSFDKQTGTIKIDDFAKFNALEDRLSAHSDELWQRGALQQKGAAVGYLDRIKGETWLKDIIHADGMKNEIIGHDDIKPEQITDFKNSEMVKHAKELLNSDKHSKDKGLGKVQNNLGDKPNVTASPDVPVSGVQKEPGIDTSQIKEMYTGTTKIYGLTGRPVDQIFDAKDLPNSISEADKNIIINNIFLARHTIGVNPNEDYDKLSARLKVFDQLHRASVENPVAVDAKSNILSMFDDKSGKVLNYKVPEGFTIENIQGNKLEIHYGWHDYTGEISYNTKGQIQFHNENVPQRSMNLFTEEIKLASEKGFNYIPGTAKEGDMIVGSNGGAGKSIFGKLASLFKGGREQSLIYRYDKASNSYKLVNADALKSTDPEILKLKEVEKAKFEKIFESRPHVQLGGEINNQVEISTDKPRTAGIDLTKKRSGEINLTKGGKK